MKTKDGLQLSYALLTTDNASPDILILKDDGELKVWGKQDFDMWKMHQQFGDFKPQGAKWQHLYITSDTPMKDGDWGIDIGGTEDAEAEIFKFWAKGTEDDDKNDEDFKKIEFTTDPKLIADGVLKIDGKTKALAWEPYPILPQRIKVEVNLLTEFCKRYNQKDNQEVDVEKMAQEWANNYTDNAKDNEMAKDSFIMGYNCKTGGFSLEDMKAMAIQVSDWKDGYVGKSDNRNLDSVVKDFIQSLTQEQPKQDSRIPGGANLRVIKPKDIVIEYNQETKTLIFK